MELSNPGSAADGVTVCTTSAGTAAGVVFTVSAAGGPVLVLVVVFGPDSVAPSQ